MKGFLVCLVLFSSGLNAQTKADLASLGRFRAVLIGIDHYQDPKIKPFTTSPVADCIALKEVLEQQYGFTDTLTLFNENASLVKIEQTLQALVETSKEMDRVFIYFSGASPDDSQWLCYDGTYDLSRTRFSSVMGYLKSIPVKQVLFLLDKPNSIKTFQKIRHRNNYDQIDEQITENQFNIMSLEINEEYLYCKENGDIFPKISFARFFSRYSCHYGSGYVTIKSLKKNKKPKLYQGTLDSATHQASEKDFTFVKRDFAHSGGSGHGSLALSSAEGGLLFVNGVPIRHLARNEVAELEGLPEGPHAVIFQVTGFTDIRETLMVKPEQWVVRHYEPDLIKGKENPVVDEAIAYYFGTKGHMDRSKAFSLFKDEWIKGDVRATMWMAKFLYGYDDMRSKNLAINLANSVNSNIVLLAKNGDKISAFLLAELSVANIIAKPSIGEASRVIEDLAEQGLPYAQLHLGESYLGLSHSNQKALLWIQRAADQNYPPAQARMGFVYATGEGVTKDDKIAEKWLKLAVAQGFWESYHDLGLLYRDGTPQDGKRALECFKVAADQGSADAQFELGMMYAEGKGIPIDNQQAVKWLLLAAAQNHEDAHFPLRKLFLNGLGTNFSRGDAPLGHLTLTAVAPGYVLVDGKPIRYMQENELTLRNLPEGPHEVVFQRRYGPQTVEKVLIQAGAMKKVHFSEAPKRKPNPTLAEACDLFFGRKGKFDWARSRQLFELALAEKDELAQLWWTWYENQSRTSKTQPYSYLPTLFDLERISVEEDEIWRLLLTHYQLGMPGHEKKHLESLRSWAYEESALAAYLLGNTYKDGIILEQDYPTALMWFQRAADQGCAQAQAKLAEMYRDGSGIQQNYAEAVKWFKLAADRGYPPAQDGLAGLYRDGHGTPQNYSQAVKWFQLAAHQGYADAQNHLGCMYGYGHGVPQDLQEALKWFRRAVDQGHHEAMCNLSLCHFQIRENGGVEGGVATVKEQYSPLTLSSSLGGLLFLDGNPIHQLVPNTKVELGLPTGSHEIRIEAIGYKVVREQILITPNQSLDRTYHPTGLGGEDTKSLQQAIDLYSGNGGKIDWPKARDLFEKAAGNGDIRAEMWIAKHLLSGECGFKKNPSQARSRATLVHPELRLLASKGDTFSMFLLADSMITGLGTHPNLQEAVRLLLELANAGSALAQNLLGIHYKNEKDEALKWFSRAADQGLAMAQANLADLHFDDRDYEEALKYYRLSADQGYAAAQHQIGVIYREGHDVSADLKTAAEWFSRAAAGDHVEAQFVLGEMYEEGKGVAKNPDEALKWFRRAAEQGHFAAEGKVIVYTKE